MGAGNSRKGIDGSLGPMCKGILLTFFYLMLAIQSKVIDQSLDRRPVLGMLWVLFNPAMSLVEAPGCCHYNCARPVTESKVKAQFSAHSRSRSLSRGRRRLNTLQRFVNQSFPSKALIRILIPLNYATKEESRLRRTRRSRKI